MEKKQHRQQQGELVDDPPPRHVGERHVQDCEHGAGVGDAAHAVANLISSDTPAQISLASQQELCKADLIVNARVAMDPEILTKLVHECVHAAVAQVGGNAEFGETQSFRPGRPVPTHRYQAS